MEGGGGREEREERGRGGGGGGRGRGGDRGGVTFMANKMYNFKNQTSFQ